MAHTIPLLHGEDLKAYHAYLQGDHDFSVSVDVLTLEESFVASVDLLDGQINFSRTTDGPERTGSLILSDPEGALSFGTSYAEDDSGTLWVNRLVRVRHHVEMPTLGRISATAMVGVPTSAARSGGEVSLELGDKSLLADHGVRPHTFKRGMNVSAALISILRDLTGEHHLRIPTTRKTLSRSYSAGMGDDVLTPWQLAKRIAGREMGWRLYYSADGYATAEPTRSAKTVVEVEAMLDLPQSSTSFTDFVNYVKVTSNRKPKNRKKGKKETASNVVSITYEAVGVLPAGNQMSEESLSRNGVRRTLPLLVSDDDLKDQKAVNKRTVSELNSNSGLPNEQTFEIMPFFHLDTADKFNLPLGVGTVQFDQASIPLGVGGNMSLGAVKWVSRPVRVKRVRSKTTVHHKKSKGGKKRG